MSEKFQNTRNSAILIVVVGVFFWRRIFVLADLLRTHTRHEAGIEVALITIVMLSILTRIPPPPRVREPCTCPLLIISENETNETK